MVIKECGICSNGTRIRKVNRESMRLVVSCIDFGVAKSRESESTKAIEVSSLLKDSTIGSDTRLVLFVLGVIERLGGAMIGQDRGRSVLWCRKSCFLKFPNVGDGDRDKVALVLVEMGENRAEAVLVDVLEEFEHELTLR